jgi:hypothetical protein
MKITEKRLNTMGIFKANTYLNKINKNFYFCKSLDTYIKIPPNSTIIDVVDIIIEHVKEEAIEKGKQLRSKEFLDLLSEGEIIN